MLKKVTVTLLVMSLGVVTGSLIGQAADPVVKNVTVGCNDVDDPGTVGIVESDRVYVVRNSNGPTDINVVADGCTNLPLAGRPSLQNSVIQRCEATTDNRLYLLKNDGTVDIGVVPLGCA